MQHQIDITPTALTYVRARYSAPSWAAGAISREDAAFLYELIRREQPQSLCEIGVASGTSTVFLSRVLSDHLTGSRLFSYDAATRFYADPARRVGEHIFDLHAGFPANLTLQAGIGSTGIRASAQRADRFDFVFDDGNHNHPWPCVDVLSILDIVRPGSWVALHDIDLPYLRDGKWQQFGPHYLFHFWPGDKCAPAGDANIGAIRLFDDPKLSARALLACLCLPWQQEVADWQAAETALGSIDPELRGRLQSFLERRKDPPKPAVHRSEVVVRGMNRWFRLAGDLTSENFIMHANRTGDPVARVTLGGLPDQQYTHAVLPHVERPAEAASPVVVAARLRRAAIGAATSTELTLDSKRAGFIVLLLPEGHSATIDLEIEVRLARDGDPWRGAWVRFAPLFLV